MKARIGVIVMTVITVVYLVLVGQRAWLLLTSGDVIGVVMGVALVVLPVLGAWGIGRELMFGMQAERLGRRAEAEGELPAEVVDVRASGRPVRDQADALFEQYRADVEAAPEDWRPWYRMGLVYDAAGDRRRARSAIRQAIRLERGEAGRSDASRGATSPAPR